VRGRVFCERVSLVICKIIDRWYDLGLLYIRDPAMLVGIKLRSKSKAFLKGRNTNVCISH
jgi:hypothetical protein